MGSRYYQRPENAISKADEFMKVGKFYHGNVKHNMAFILTLRGDGILILFLFPNDSPKNIHPTFQASDNSNYSGKPARALDTLYDVIKSKKRNHSVSEKLIEEIMFRYLELCVDLKKSHVAKEGLFQYRNMCQSTNVASLASVVQGYLNMAEKRTESARQESDITC